MAFEIINCEQNSDEWYRARMKIPTSSQFQCLLAKSADRKGRATYMRQLAAEILTDERGESFTNQAMERGHAMEQEARDNYAFLHDCEPQLIGFIKSGRKGGSPDSLIGNDGLLARIGGDGVASDIDVEILLAERRHSAQRCKENADNPFF